MDKVLVLGGSGLVGKAIINEISKVNKYDIYATYFKNGAPLSEDRSYRLNAEDTDNIKHILDSVKPQNVISCLRGNFDKQLILHTEIAQYLKETGGRLYFCSTTNVFDNDLSRPHYEDDTPDSQTDYGKYKIECEKRIQQILQEDACILRLPQVWGKDSPRMKQLIKSLKDKENIEVYPRLSYNTTTAGMIARKTAYILEHNLKGIFHLASEDTINYKEFYSELAKKLGFSNPEFEENYEEEGQFALLSKRSNEFPEELRVTNKWVINYLAGTEKY